MAAINRLMVANWIQAITTTLAASSAQVGFPVSNLRDQLRSRTVRTAVGWTVVAGANDAIDFQVDDGAKKTAFIAAGTYATGALYGAAVVAALTAAEANGWTFAYNNAGLHLCTIGGDVVFRLLWESGDYPATAAHKDLGFEIADTAFGLTRTGVNAVYQSRHYISAVLTGTAANPVQALIVVNHNSGTGGIYSVNAHESGGALLFDQVLAGDASVRVAYLAASYTPRYCQLVIDDCANPLGYAEAGIWYAGPYVETLRGQAAGWGKEMRPQNVLAFAVAGAHFVDQKPSRPAWTAINWPGQTEATRDLLMAALALVPAGTCFFFAFDAVANPAATEYVMLEGAAAYQHTDGDVFDVPAPTLLGALG